jgi:hypothetical protein
MPAAIFVWIQPKLQFTVGFVRLDPASDRAGNRRMVVIYAAIDDPDAHPRTGAITPRGLRIQDLR